jgi:hypothetical protein
MLSQACPCTPSWHRLPKAVEMLEREAAESRVSKPYTPPSVRERVLARNRSSTDHFVDRLTRSRRASRS